MLEFLSGIHTIIPNFKCYSISVLHCPPLNIYSYNVDQIAGTAFSILFPCSWTPLPERRSNTSYISLAAHYHNLVANFADFVYNDSCSKSPKTAIPDPLVKAHQLTVDNLQSRSKKCIWGGSLCYPEKKFLSGIRTGGVHSGLLESSEKGCNIRKVN